MSQKKLRNISSSDNIDYVLSDDNVFTINTEGDIESIKYYKAPYVRVWLNDEEEWEDFPKLYRTEKWTETSYEEVEGGIFAYEDNDEDDDYNDDDEEYGYEDEGSNDSDDEEEEIENVSRNSTRSINRSTSEDINSHKGQKIGQFYDTYNPVYSGETYYRIGETMDASGVMIFECINQHEEGIYYDSKIYYGLIPFVIPNNPSYGLIDEESEYADEYSNFDDNGYAISDLSPEDGETLQTLNGKLILSFSDGDESLIGTYTPFFNTTINNTPYYAFLSTVLIPRDTAIKEIFYLPTSADTTFNTLSAYTGYVQLRLDDQAYLMTKETMKEFLNFTDEMIGEMANQFENDIFLSSTEDIVILEKGIRKIVQEKVGPKEIAVENGHRYSLYSGITFTTAINDDDPHYRASDCGCIGSVEFHRIKHIPDDICNGCSISSVTFDKYAESIGEYAFYGCENLSSFTITENLSYIGNNAFGGTNIKQLTYDGNTLNPQNILRGFQSVSSLTIADSTTEILNNFPQMSSLKYVEIGEGITVLPNYLFSNVLSIETIVIKGNLTTIPAMFSSLNSSEVALKEIIMPETVQTIGSNAFLNCKNLSAITLSDNLTSIEDRAFYGCTNLTTIEIPSSCKSIGYYAFDSCNSLTELIIPEGVTYLSQYSIGNNTNLKTLVIPSTIQNQLGSYNPWNQGNHIFDKVILNCSAITINCGNIDGTIKELEIGPNVHIANEAFYHDSNNIEKLILHEGVRIGAAAFFYNTNLTHVELPNDLPSISAMTFMNCWNLTSIDIPNSVTYIGSSAFHDCTYLRDVNIGSGVTVIDNNAFNHCPNLSAVTLSDGLLKIEDNSFANCGSLSSITIPNTVVNIGFGAFGYCTNLTTIILPISITNIGDYAFGSCTNLTKIYYKGSATGFPWGASNATLITDF